jgi:hypothetical protein
LLTLSLPCGGKHLDESWRSIAGAKILAEVIHRNRVQFAAAWRVICPMLIVKFRSNLTIKQSNRLRCFLETKVFCLGLVIWMFVMDKASTHVDPHQLSWADYVDRLEAAALDQALEKRKRQRARSSPRPSDTANGNATPPAANTHEAQTAHSVRE